MPIYEYECKQCRSRFERLESISQDPINICPACGGEAQRLVTKTAGFIIDGSSTSQSDLQGGHCGNLSPCCGRETRCDEKPCD
ncbi:MAG: zinc ribbon domain-containing protein [Candidatus Hatepunaea meridiana]|nr:zinc ribbon domain-containing protein [Candidatus Hatepunaea meridiana]